MSVRTVFMGSPEFALPSLRALAAHFHVVGVVTQPDRPAGRGQNLTPPPVKTLAISLALPFIQPIKLRDPDAMKQLETWNPDLIVVAAFGQILRQNVLNMPKFGCINVHASLLPRWRGASPIQAAIAAGDQETGITIMKMDAGIDTGDILAQEKITINSDDTALLLEKRLADLGGHLLIRTLIPFLVGEIQAVPQPSEGFTYAQLLKKEDGELDFREPVVALERKVRAYQPWPGTFINWEGGQLKVLASSVFVDVALTSPGSRTIINKQPAIAAQDGWLVLNEVQPQGKKCMRGDVFLNGARGWKQVESQG
jgi:methionyl-tRNA formyltransferase